MTRSNTILQRMLAALEVAPAPKGLTRYELQALLKISNASVTRNVNKLCNQELAYVCRWERAKGGQGPAVAAFTAGNLEDVECNFDVFTQAELSKRMRERRKPLPVVDFLTQCFFGLGA